MLDHETRTPVWHCHTCGYRMDTTSGLNKPKPDPGDVNICMKCGELYIFTDELIGRKPTVRELIDIQRSVSWREIERVRWAIGEMNKKIAAGELPPYSS